MKTVARAPIRGCGASLPSRRVVPQQMQTMRRARFLAVRVPHASRSDERPRTDRVLEQVSDAPIVGGSALLSMAPANLDHHAS